MHSNKTKNETSLITTAFDYLNKTHQELEFIPIVSSLWNAYQLKNNTELLQISHQKQISILNAIRNGRSTVPLLIDDPDLLRSVNERHLQAIKETIKRLYLTSAAYGIRVIRISSILFQPKIRRILEDAFDTITYSLSVYKHSTSRNPTHILRPLAVTTKDRAYKIMKAATSMLCLAWSSFALANSCNYINDSNSFYQTATKLGKISLAIDIADAGLQALQLIAQRE